MSMKLILSYSVIEPLRYFMDQFALAAQKMQIDYYCIDSNKSESYLCDEFYSFINDSSVYMITFNGALVELMDTNGENFWKTCNIPVFTFINDHPRNYDSFLHNPPCEIHVMSLDYNHIDFMHRFFPDLSSVTFCPNGGVSEEGKKPYRDRTIDVIYMGDCQQEIESFPEIPGFPNDGNDLFQFAIHELINDPHKSAEQAVYDYFDSAHILINDENMYKLLMEANVSAIIEIIIRRYYKLTCMKALDDAGIKVDIYGDLGSWSDREIVFSDRITVHPRIPNKEVNRLVGNSKISLSFLPWYKRGTSEKPIDSMLNGAVCVCDHSDYLENNYIDGQNIVYFDLNNPDQLAADVKWLLSNPDTAEAIARNGYNTAKKYDTWENRFQILIDTIKSLKE